MKGKKHTKVTMQAFCDVLKVEDPTVVTAGLDVLNSYLEAKREAGIDSLHDALDEFVDNGCIDILEDLQRHHSEEIYEKAKSLLVKYFADEGYPWNLAQPAAANAGDHEEEEVVGDHEEEEAGQGDHEEDDDEEEDEDEDYEE
jgi:hypothetical protein